MGYISPSATGMRLTETNESILSDCKVHKKSNVSAQTPIMNSEDGIHLECGDAERKMLLLRCKAVAASG